MFKIMVTKAHYILLLQVAHTVYLYNMQDLLIRYGFLEHDDYQEYFKTYNITQGMIMILPLAMYSSSFLLIFTLTVVYKYLIGYIAFSLF